MLAPPAGDDSGADCGGQVMGDMLLYPNSMSFDIMEGGGIQPPPKGVLQVTVVRVPKLSGGGDLLSKVCCPCT